MIKNCVLSTSDSKVAVDHVSNLSSTKKPIFFRSLLVLQTNLFLEVGILDDLFKKKMRFSRPASQNFGIVE